MTSVLFSNVASALDLAPLTDDKAIHKVLQLSVRHIWPDYDVVVLPQGPEPLYEEYARRVGARAQVVVPNTLDLRRLTMLDALQDASVRACLQGSQVACYAPHPALERGIKIAGGLCGVSGGIELNLGRKTLFRNYFGKYLAVPHGSVQIGTPAIANEVLQLLAAGARKVGVRDDFGGGGIGLYTFERITSFDQIIEELGGVRSIWALVELWLDDVFIQPTIYLDCGLDEPELLATSLQITCRGPYAGSQLPCPEAACSHETLSGLTGVLRQRLQSLGYYRRGGFDLGKRQGMPTLLGFEFNNRMTALEHPLAIARLVFQMPFAEWATRGWAILSFDVFNLFLPMNFEALYDRLDRAGLIGWPGDDEGVAISIPPFDGVAGLVIWSKKGHAGCVDLFEKVQTLVGSEDNVFDQPLYRQ
jgi:hypothetical protein